MVPSKITKLQNYNVSFCPDGLTNPNLTTISLQNLLLMIKETDQQIQAKINRIREYTEMIKNKDGVEIDTKSLQVEKDIFKKSLPYFNLAPFRNNYRKNDNFIETKLLLFDIDKLEDVETVRKIIDNDSRVYFSFISPSGNGLKVVLILDEPITDKDLYSKVYKSLVAELSSDWGVELDNTSDASRACSLSFDPNLYLNPDCQLICFSKYLEKIQKTIQKENLNSEQNPLKEKLDLPEGERNSYFFKKIMSLKDRGLKREEIEDYCLAINDGFADPLDDDEILEIIQRKIKELEITEFVVLNDKNKYEIDFDRFKDFCRQHNIFRLDRAKDYEYIMLENNLISIITPQDIKQVAIDFLPTKKIQNYLSDIDTKFFNKTKINTIDKYDQNCILENDSKEITNFYFNNGFVQVTKDKVDFKEDFNELTYPIYSKNKLNRDFKLLGHSEFSKGFFYQFLENVTGKNKERFLALCTSIGYLMNRYFDESETKAIIYIDEKYLIIKVKLMVEQVNQ